MAAKLKDIAEASGVDIGSVSRTLNKHPRAMSLRPETRKRIIETARNLGYRPNILAATVRTGESKMIAVIGKFDKVKLVEFYNAVISGLLIESTRLGYGLKIYPDNDLEASFNEIIGYQIKHVVCISVDKKEREETAELCKKHKLELIYIYESPNGEFPSVTTADRKSASEAVERLIELGHKNIALICARHTYNYMNERHGGYLDAMKSAGLKIRKELICCESKDNVVESRIDSMLRMPENSRPTAFFCIGDSWAMLVQRSAVRNNFKIPEDISVIGFGNSDLGELMLSPLSTVSQPFRELGGAALRILLAQEHHLKPSSNGTYLLSNKFVNRKSIAYVKKGRI